ncbi:DUF397 domain-containing protein [Actinomadura barringtoniae]|uniref:DUF397 domain-containing protein n=1 Tax=Actinomadura barringtoniae TaxID=1427535 RepID=A0A939PNV2_9ACTN|nr:DUF397 domain-containing protein [Actinomadura barringtoniae]MBO2455675.1 DUF397 domain-containing protein [Actinomadura barringtoniae]
MTTWRKSSHSASSGQEDCVELARLAPAIGVRDSKAPGAGHLALSVESLADLVARVKRNELDL